MPMTPGTRLGPYEIVAPLGAGGMGEVYRAKDTRLGRDVAVKVLPLHLSDQPDVRARFEREAKTISSLNHPNICMLFDVGQEGETDYLVMELIEGETLAERLKRGPLSVAELMRFGVQIADALDRAHRAGVIHRDLKPGNVMITRSGAKLMDFGLSRVAESGVPGSGSKHSLVTLTHSPTMAQALTAEGTLLGTFQYMAPEQLEGKEADARSDIWALGCVLYEMATGKHAFEGRSQASLIAAILEREPPAVGEVPSGSGVVAPSAPPHGMERLIRNCLTKDPEERIQTAHDVKLQLQGIAEGAGLSSASVASASSISAAVAAATAARPRGASARLPWAITAVGVLAAAGVFAWLYPRIEAPAPAVRFRVGTVEETRDIFWPRVSPDGKFLLMQGVDTLGTVRAYLRPMDQLDAHAIPGTEGLQRAYWSPDSREIVFVANDKIQRVTIAGGSPVVICAAPGGADLSWGSKGFILMDGRFTDSLKVVPAGGGELRPATAVDRSAGEIGTAWPSFLPDGEHFLFIGNASSGTGGNMRLGKLGSLDSKLLGKSDGRVEYAPGGWIVFLRGTTLLAQKLDVGAGKLTGQPITLADGVRVGGASGHFSVSEAGILVIARDDGGSANKLFEASRAGALLGAPLVTGNLANPRLSPEGRRLLYERFATPAGGTGEMYVLDLDRATDTRLTFTGDIGTTPHWSPDGRRFAYVTRTAAGVARLRFGSADGLGAQDSILVPEGLGASLNQWAEAGSRLVVSSSIFHGYVVPSEGADRAITPLPDTIQVVAHQQISPDGRWLSFVTGTGPVFQIYVQSLEGPPGRWQISTKGGIYAYWTRGGKELVYEDQDSRVYAVDIDTQDGFHAGTPHVLFTLPVASFSADNTTWGVSADGERFFLVVPERSRRAGNIEVVTRFRDLVTRK